MLVADFLREITTQVESFTPRVEDVTRDLNDEQLNWSPRPAEQWSINQTLKHVVLANRLYIPSLQQASREAEAVPAGEEVRHTWYGNRLVKRMGPGGGAPVSSLLDPGRGPYGREVLDHFIHQQEEVIGLLTKVKERDLSGTKFRCPTANLLKVSLADALRLVAVHTAYHIRQMETIPKHPAFPAAKSEPDLQQTPLA